MSSVPADLLSAVVTILAILLYFYMGIRVGQMRGKHNVKAPVVSGHPEFERAFRVHYNTLEALPVFFALLWLATVYFRTIGWLPGLLGVVFALTGVLVGAAGFLFQVVVHRNRRVELGALLRPLFFVVLGVSASATAAVMVVVTLGMTRLSQGG